MDTLTDQQLLEQLRAGNAKAIDQLLNQYQQRVYRFGLRMCGNEADARDVLQETLLAAFKNLRTFRGDAQLSTWLFQIARSFCTKQRRRHQGEPAVHEAVDSLEAQRVGTPDAPADARLHAAEVGHVIQTAMSSLSEDQREVIVLRDIEGLSAEQAADVLGIEVGALKSRLHRSRMALKNQLSISLKEPQPSTACPQLTNELAAYAASEIDQAACEKIEAHLATCQICSTACDSLKRTVSLCRQLPGGEVPSGVRSAVRAALMTALQQ